jgi:hypothetical protein
MRRRRKNPQKRKTIAFGARRPQSLVSAVIFRGEAPSSKSAVQMRLGFLATKSGIARLAAAPKAVYAIVPS